MTRAIEVGTVCIKTTGREAGKKTVVIEIVDDNFVVVEGPSVRKRKCNIAHLFPTGEKVSVGKNTTKKELKEILAK